MERNHFVHVRFSEAEFQILQAKKKLLKVSTNSEVVRKCVVAEADNLKDLMKWFEGHDQREIRVQRQNYVILKLCEGLMMELAKLDRFLVKTPPDNQKIVAQYLETAIKKAEEHYK